MTAHFLSPEALRQIMDTGWLSAETWDAAVAFEDAVERMSGARVDPPARFDVTLPAGMEAPAEQEAALQERGSESGPFADVRAELTRQVAAAFGWSDIRMETTTSFDPASDSVAIRLYADESPYRRHWLNARVFDETSAEVERYGYARRDVRWYVPPEGGNLPDGPVATWVDETAAWADSGVACAREFGDGCDCPECRARHAEIEASAAVWLEILARETEIAASPLEAARRVFGSVPPL